MKVKLYSLGLGMISASLIFSACGGTESNGVVNSTNNTRTNSPNTATVVNANNNVVVSNINTATNRWSNTNNVNRADYDKNRADYERDKGSSTIGQGANDSWLWFKTRAALLATNDLRESTINVDVVNDKITLKGTVANAEQKKKAEDVAKGIDGQKGVTNELKVAPTDSMTNMNSSSTGNTKSSNANVNKK